MKIKSLLLTTAIFLCCGHAFGADTAAANPDAAAKANASSDVKATAKAAVKPKAKAKPKKKRPVKAKKPAKKPVEPRAAEAPDADPAVIAAATELYKKELAEKIARAVPDKVYTERPQALLRSVVVLEFAVDATGKLVKSAVRRSNHDHETETTALASLKAAAPLPKPPPILVRHGPVELHETWLFNKDGRFQVRSTALQQLDR